MKKTIQINEAEIRQMVNECVKRVLNEWEAGDTGLSWQTLLNAYNKSMEWRKKNPFKYDRNRPLDFQNAAVEKFYKDHGIKNDDIRKGHISLNPYGDEVTLSASRDHDFNDGDKHNLGHNLYHMGKEYGDGFKSGYGRTRMWDFAHETTPEEFFDDPEMAEKFRAAEKDVDNYRNSQK